MKFTEAQRKITIETLEIISGFNPNEVVINDDTNLAEEFGLDSLDVVELTVELEKEFNIRISDDKIEEIKTFSDLERVVLSSPTKKTE
jgi:acyl carrier protein